MDQVLVRGIVIIPHNAAVLHIMLQEPMVLVASHAIVEQVLIDSCIDVMAIGQIEGQETLLVEPSCKVLAVWTLGMKVLRRFALNKDRVWPLLQDGMHRQDIGLAKMLQSRYERSIALQPLIPPAKLGRERCRDEDLIHRRIEAYRWKSPRKRLRVLRKQR